MSTPTLSSLADIPGLSVSAGGNVDPGYSLSFAGKGGGAGEVAKTFEFWNVTFGMPADFEGVPRLVLEFEVP